MDGISTGVMMNDTTTQTSCTIIHGKSLKITIHFSIDWSTPKWIVIPVSTTCFVCRGKPKKRPCCHESKWLFVDHIVHGSEILQPTYIHALIVWCDMPWFTAFYCICYVDILYLNRCMISSIKCFMLLQSHWTKTRSAVLIEGFPAQNAQHLSTPFKKPFS